MIGILFPKWMKFVEGMMAVWWNGRHASLKRKFPKGSAGSTPVAATNSF